ncbi:MAG: DUF503 domain-containing protein [Actinomycetota bacterium]
MFVGMARYDFLVPGSTSLKDKRKVVKHLVGATASRFHVSIAEVDHQDLRQRGAIGVACVSNSPSHVQKMLDEITRFMDGEYRIEVVDRQSEVVGFE